MATMAMCTREMTEIRLGCLSMGSYRGRKTREAFED